MSITKTTTVSHFPRLQTLRMCPRTRGKVNSQFCDQLAMSSRQRTDVPIDHNHCEKRLTFCKGMKVRLTKNLDKDWCFVIGSGATIVQMLNKRTAVAVPSGNVRILINAVADSGKQLLVVAVYGYAMTNRRTQGCTLAMGGLYFDRRVADGGCECVGASRVRRKNDLHFIGVCAELTTGILAMTTQTQVRTQIPETMNQIPMTVKKCNVLHTQTWKTALVKIWNRVSTASISSKRTSSLAAPPLSVVRPSVTKFCTSNYIKEK